MEPRFPVGSRVIVKEAYKENVKQFFDYKDDVDKVLTVKKCDIINKEVTYYYFKNCRTYLFCKEIEVTEGQMRLPFKW